MKKENERFYGKNIRNPKRLIIKTKSKVPCKDTVTVGDIN